MKLAIVGCGLAVRWLHLPALEKLQDSITVTSLLSRTRASAEGVAELLAVQRPDCTPRVFDTLGELLAEGDFNAVLLSLPTEHNLFYIEAFLLRKIPVICEKPIALHVAQGKEILALVKKYGNLLYIAENYRHLPELHKTKKLIDSGVIGNARVLLWNSWNCIKSDEGYGATEWRANSKHVGGYLSDGGVHHVAGIRVLMGNISDVKGFGFQQAEYTGNLDTFSGTLQFKSGAIGNYSGTYALTEGGDLYMVRGTKGYITFSHTDVDVYTGVDGATHVHYDIEPSMGYYEEFVDFVKFVDGIDSGLGAPQEALEDLRVIEQLVSSFSA